MDVAFVHRKMVAHQILQLLTCYAVSCGHVLVSRSVHHSFVEDEEVASMGSDELMMGIYVDRVRNCAIYKR